MTETRNGSVFQYHVPGKSDQGYDRMLLVSMPVPGKVKLILNGETIHIEIEELKKLTRDLFPVKGVKHAGTL